MKKILLIIICLITVFTSFACINEYRTFLTGQMVYTDPSSGKIWTKKIDTTELRKKAKKLINNYQKSDSIEYYSDYASALTYLGEYKEAKSIYHEIERISPNLYTTASNLGTVYELIGKPDSALLWIRKSVELNPNSHHGSEWIHIKILEFKISKKSDFSSSILDLDFGQESKPINAKKYELTKLEDHIRHQLRERTLFVKPKDPIVGNIYFDLGNVIAQTTDVQAALESYESAIEYGFESELMNKRIAEFNSLAKTAIEKNKESDLYETDLKISLAIVFISFILFFIWIIRKIKKRKAMD